MSSESQAPLDERSRDIVRKKSARELGASLVLAIHRLLKIVQIHALDNMAVVQQLDQTTEALRIFCSRVQGPATFLFAKHTVFVSGQLLKASRTEYDAALELGATLATVGVSELVLEPGVDSRDLEQFAAAVVSASRDRQPRSMPRRPAARIRVRRVDAAALLVDDEDLPNDERIVRTYAQAVVVMRRALETLAEGRWELPHEAKRIAQKLVMLSEGDTPAFLGVTAMRNANHDLAGRAVNASILAVAMCRLLTDDLSILSRIAMASLLYDVGRPYLAGAERTLYGGRLGDDEERRMPSAVAYVNTLLGGFRLPSMVRTVIGFEAHWHARTLLLGAPYEAERSICLAARIVAAAHRFNALLTPDPAAPTLLGPDAAVAVMRRESRDPDDGAVLALLVGAIGLFPAGTIVELSSGERAVVIESPNHPAEYVRPRVRIVYTANGELVEPPRDLDLRDDESRVVIAIERHPDERLRTVRQQIFVGTEPTSDAAPTPRLAQRDDEPIDTARAVARRSELPPTVKRVPWVSTQREQPAPVYRSSAPPSPAAVPRPGGARTSTMPSMKAVRPESDRSERVLDVSIATLSPPGSAAAPISATDRAPSSISGVFSLISANVKATARGTLARTPMAHLIVYVLERRLSGTLVLTPAEESGLEHGLYFDRGVPVRIWTPARVAPLDRILVELGHLDHASLEDPLLSIVRDHEAALEAELLRAGLVSEEQVIQARGLQLRRGTEFLFGLRETTEYAFFADVDLVEGHVGSTRGCVPPLELLVAGVRKRGEDSVSTRVLARLGNETLELDPGLRAESFGFDLDEASAFEALALGSPSLPELEQNPLLDPIALRRVVYVLLLTRSLVVGEPSSARIPIENPTSSR